MFFFRVFSTRAQLPVLHSTRGYQVHTVHCSDQIVPKRNASVSSTSESLRHLFWRMPTEAKWFFLFLSLFTRRWDSPHRHQDSRAQSPSKDQRHRKLFVVEITSHPPPTHSYYKLLFCVLHNTSKQQRIRDHYNNKKKVPPPTMSLMKVRCFLLLYSLDRNEYCRRVFFVFIFFVRRFPLFHTSSHPTNLRVAWLSPDAWW